jgi:hypothetical protein
MATTLMISGGYFLEPVSVILVGPTTIYTLPVQAVSHQVLTAIVPEGLQAQEYQVLVANDNQPGGAAISPTPGTLALFDPADACFYDFFESGAGQWQRGGDWGIATLSTGERAMTDSPIGPYKNPADYGSGTISFTTSITSPAFNLAGCPNPVLTFRHAYELAKMGDSQDTATVEISTDNGRIWTPLTSYTGGGIFTGLDSQEVLSSEWGDLKRNTDWRQAQIDLGDYTGTVRLRFNLQVTDTISSRGWILDNLMVTSGTGAESDNK